jgi:hypothetical protein
VKQYPLLVYQDRDTALCGDERDQGRLRYEDRDHCSHPPVFVNTLSPLLLVQVQSSNVGS